MQEIANAPVRSTNTAGELWWKSSFSLYHRCINGGNKKSNHEPMRAQRYQLGQSLLIKTETSQRHGINLMLWYRNKQQMATQISAWTRDMESQRTRCPWFQLWRDAFHYKLFDWLSNSRTILPSGFCIISLILDAVCNSRVKSILISLHQRRRKQ